MDQIIHMHVTRGNTAWGETMKVKGYIFQSLAITITTRKSPRQLQRAIMIYISHVFSWKLLDNAAHV